MGNSTDGYWSSVLRSIENEDDSENTKGGDESSHLPLFSANGNVNNYISSIGQGQGVTEDDLVDPAPDVHALFIQYNSLYFYEKLGCVELKWSKRMTLCAGVCQYYGSRSGLCSIRLSEPILKFRPRSDLVDTLLHEMIHAYLFVSHNNTDRDGHGPMFQKHMKRINDLAGTSITIYHSFHDEVDVHRKHIWRCTGQCRKRPPYFGYIRRANNRAPGPYDFWYSQHQSSCDGVFVKEAEPEGYKSKKRKTTSYDNRGIEKSKSKMMGFKGPIKNEIDILLPGVKCEEVVPFSSAGYVLGTGVKVGTTTATEASGSKQKTNLKSKATDKTVSVKKKTTATTKGRQSILDHHFSPPEKIRSEKLVDQLLKPSDCIELKSSQSVASTSEVICNSNLHSTNEFTRVTSGKNCDKNGDVKNGLILKSNNAAHCSSAYNDSSNELTTSQPSPPGGATVHRVVNCPVCNCEIEQSLINDHLDYCLVS